MAAKHGLAGVEGGALGGLVHLAGDLAATEGAPGALAEKMGAEETGGRVVAFTPSMKLVGWAAAEREQAQEFFLDDARVAGMSGAGSRRSAHSAMTRLTELPSG